jgi:hypothetical protein
MDLFGKHIYEHEYQKAFEEHFLFTMNEERMNEYKNIQECCCDGALGVVQLGIIWREKVV